MNKLIEILILIASILMVERTAMANENKVVGFTGVKKDNIGYLKVGVNYFETVVSPQIFYLNPAIGYKYNYHQSSYLYGVESSDIKIDNKVKINALFMLGSSEYKYIYQFAVDYMLSTHISLQTNYSYNKLAYSNDINQFGFGLLYKF